MFSSKNHLIFGLSLAALVVGYVLLAQGPVNNHLSWSVAPVILCLAYLVLFPLSILYTKKENGKKPTGKGV